MFLRTRHLKAYAWLHTSVLQVQMKIKVYLLLLAPEKQLSKPRLEFQSIKVHLWTINCCLDGICYKNFVGTLFKVREGAVALTADIEQMFLKSKWNNLIFLYSNVENEIERIVIYNYNRHIIGARSSQTCANYSLTRTLEIDNLHKLSNVFCMDDFIFPLNDQLETENFRKEVVENLSRDGFKLTKFQCNVEEFHEKAVENEASILGRFRSFSSMSNEGLTSWRIPQRDLLSVVSWLFDPLAVLSTYRNRNRNILKK